MSQKPENDESTPSGKLLDRIKDVLGVETDLELARQIQCHRTQISRIRRSGFPQYVSSLFELLLPLLEIESNPPSQKNKC